ncbi:MAG: hypothetical protein K2W92_08935 [Alphaproteobacteria bacterium]|nr:hypothetical protein [Alphaproteobacteria bacterium]
MFDIYVQDQFLKTPAGNPFEVPTLALAKAIEEEWEKNPAPDYTQKPMTALVATALDRVAEARESYVTYAIQAVAKDVVLFWAPKPDTLVKLQREKWAAVIEKVNQSLDLTLTPTLDLTLHPLSAEEEQKVKIFLYSLTTFKLAAFVHLLTLTSSFSLSFLLYQSQLSPSDAWELAHLHEYDQRRVWGHDPETLAREESSCKEFLQTFHFLQLVV